MKILILGGYGFIGLEAACRLLAHGHEVTALGRNGAHGRRVLPAARWLSVDIATLDTAEEWLPLLGDIEIVVNASGALQDGLRDNLAAVQAAAIIALIAACEANGVKRFIQISAPGASASAATPFLRTKAHADAALAASTLDWVILRPGLVWGRTATGGTALVRTLAAFPLVQPILLAGARVQSVDIDEVSEAIALAVGAMPPGTDVDLVEAEPVTLREMLKQVRNWHGFSGPLAEIHVPALVGALLARIGDAAGWLGWRTPLRTTSLRALEQGVLGNPALWRAISGRDVASLPETLARRPATKQDRLFARLHLLLPLIVLTLAAFWIGSGLVGLAHRDAAAALLAGRVGQPVALVTAGSIVDIALGLSLLWRPWARFACFGMIAATGAYLVGGALFTPQLWADPLGPLVKPLPAALLALVCASLLEER